MTLSKDVKDCTPIERLARTISLQPGEVVLMIFVCLIVFAIMGFYNHYSVTLIGAIYPIYMSFKVLTLKFRAYT
jgi:predicted ABC-type exoprotein transport system permease subunit